MTELQQLLTRPEFPRSSRYDTDWMLDNHIGPNALWLCEWLCEKLPISAGMRVLDLGCGKATTSIFLAREFGATVFAADLWMNPDNNWRRVAEAGVADRVYPLKAEAHALPFAQGFFDAVVCIDAYQYFGTDELYLDYLSRFVKPGGLFGVVAVGLARPIDGEIPEHLTKPQTNGKVFWEDSCRCFKTTDFWRTLWRRNAKVTGVEVDAQPDGWRHWRDFEHALSVAGKNVFPSYEETLTNDAGHYLAFLRLIARRSEATEFNFYDPNLGALAGVDK